MTTVPGLDAGLFVRGDDKVVVFQRFSSPLAFIQVKNATGLDRELRITREYPRPVLPRANGIFIEPAPYRLITYCGHYTRRTNFASDVRSAPSR